MEVHLNRVDVGVHEPADGRRLRARLQCRQAERAPLVLVPGAPSVPQGDHKVITTSSQRHHSIVAQMSLLRHSVITLNSLSQGDEWGRDSATTHSSGGQRPCRRYSDRSQHQPAHGEEVQHKNHDEEGR